MPELEPTIVEWPLLVSALNRRTNRQRLKPGELSISVGVDGKYTGGLRKHPGMVQLVNLGDKTGVNLGTPYDMWYVSLQKGAASNTILRGFVFLHNDGAIKLTYRYYDTSAAAWASKILAQNGVGGMVLATDSVVSVSGSSLFQYIAIKGQDPQVFYWSGAAIVVGDMGPGIVFDSDGDTGLAAPADGGEGAGGYLNPGVYRYAYRFFNDSRHIYSALSTTYEDTVAGDDQKVTLTNPYAADLDAAWDQGYTHLQVFRTLSGDIAGTAFDAGILYMESEYALDAGADCWPAAVEVGTLSDEELTQVEDIYDPWRDIPGSPPKSGVIAFHEGMNFMGPDTGDPKAELRWSQPHRYNPEVFPSNGYRIQWRPSDGTPQSIHLAGDRLFVFTDSAAFRVTKAGAQLAVARMHSGRAPVNRYAAHSLGRDLIAVTDMGLTLYDGMSGTMQILGFADRILFDDWASELGSVRSGADGASGTSWFINTTAEEALVIWHVAGTATVLEDCRCTATCEGPDPVTGGRSRLWIVTPEFKILRPATTFSESGDMLGLETGTEVNGTCDSDGGANLVECLAAPSGHFTEPKLEGAYIYVWTGEDNEAPQHRRVASVGVGNASVVTANPAFNPVPSEGDRWTISPVPYRVRPHPLSTGENRSGRKTRDFGRKVASTVSIFAVDHTGISGNTNAKWRVGICRNHEDTPSVSVSVDMDADPHDCCGAVAVDGVTLEPWIEHIAADTDFELLSVSVDGKIVYSRRTG